MKIFVAGATGVVGRQLVPLLVRRGHDVLGTTRSARKASTLRELGAEPVVVDPLDRDALLRAIGSARPEVIVHQSMRRTLRAIRHLERAVTEARGIQGVVSATVTFMDPEPPSREEPISTKPSGGAASPWSAAVQACGRSST